MKSKYKTEKVVVQDLAIIKQYLGDTIIRHPLLDTGYELIQKTINDNRYLSENKHVIIIGEAGCGKSSLIDLYQAEHLSETRTFELGCQLESQAIFTSVPSPVTPKSMSAELLKAIGDRTGLSQTSYQLTERLVYQINHSNIEVVFLDEFQHLLSLGTKSRTQSISTRLRESMDWLKSLTNKTDVTYVLMGMPELLYLIQADPQMARRFTNTHYLGPFCEPSSTDNNLSVFADELLLKASELQLQVHNSTYFREIDYFQDYNNDAIRLYAATQGSPSNIKQLIINAACTAYLAGSREINMSYFTQALDLQERATQEAKRTADKRRIIQLKKSSGLTEEYINPFTENIDAVRNRIAGYSI